jgi:uncharacterized protein YecE (DUF72 family)
MPPTAYLTSPVGYVRLHGRNPQDWAREFGRTQAPASRHDYLYSTAELEQWRTRIDHLQRLAGKTFVFANNDASGKSIVNALQLAALLGDDRRAAPAELFHRYRGEIASFHAERAVQTSLFNAAA